jgi:hypothetical protein
LKKIKKSVVKLHQKIGLSIKNEKEIGEKLNKKGGKSHENRTNCQHSDDFRVTSSRPRKKTSHETLTKRRYPCQIAQASSA